MLPVWLPYSETCNAASHRLKVDTNMGSQNLHLQFVVQKQPTLLGHPGSSPEQNSRVQNLSDPKHL